MEWPHSVFYLERANSPAPVHLAAVGTASNNFNNDDASSPRASAGRPIYNRGALFSGWPLSFQTGRGLLLRPWDALDSEKTFTIPTIEYRAIQLVFAPPEASVKPPPQPNYIYFDAIPISGFLLRRDSSSLGFTTTLSMKVSLDETGDILKPQRRMGHL